MENFEDMIEDKLNGFWENTKKAILSGLVLAIPIGAYAYITKTKVGKIDPPQQHVVMANKIKAYYPWKVLRKECVYVGREKPEGSDVVLPQTTWLWFYEDEINVDVACVMVISTRIDHYSIEFARMDAGTNNGGKLIVEVEGLGKFEDFFQTESLLGYRTLKVNI